MSCLDHICQKSEYQPKVDVNKIKTKILMKETDKDYDNCLKTRDEAIKIAENNHKQACKNLNETLVCPGDCECDGEGAFGKWGAIKKGQTWKQDATTKDGSKWEVILTNDLEYRETTPGKCYKKSPPSPKG